MIVPVDSPPLSSFLGAGEAVIEGRSSEVEECFVDVEVAVDSVLLAVFSFSVVEVSVLELLVSLGVSDCVIDEISVVSVKVEEEVDEELEGVVVVVDRAVVVVLVVLLSSTLSVDDEGESL